jgi:hypothetical protein
MTPIAGTSPGTKGYANWIAAKLTSRVRNIILRHRQRTLLL